VAAAAAAAAPRDARDLATLLAAEFCHATPGKWRVQMLRSHSPSNLPERGGALSFAQQVKLVTPEFQALISSCTKVRALLDAIVPCPHPLAGPCGR
jgi:hypothetical protein